MLTPALRWLCSHQHLINGDHSKVFLDIFPSVSYVYSYTILFDYYCFIKCFKHFIKLNVPPSPIILSIRVYL